MVLILMENTVMNKRRVSGALLTDGGTWSNENGSQNVKMCILWILLNFYKKVGLL